eukprot:TRINITY_DN2593_c0_g1_i2.p1 TRINITY_DN2593_c0_g1~~TRINITY_DN2593_c0_g1_i2.p1  ORF type:complete len:183 (+),score=41.57 TRINITY_DN2593_c0_g1_i2:360-908(+)
MCELACCNHSSQNFIMFLGGKRKPLSQIVFEKYDTDKSGSVDIHEFHGMCYDLGHFLTKKETDIALKVVDKDGSGKVELKEFTAWWKDSKRFDKFQKTPEEMEWVEKAVKEFRVFDKDSSGTVTADEFNQLCPKLKAQGLTDKDPDAVLGDLDQDGSGEISFNEYIEWLAREPKQKTVITVT